MPADANSSLFARATQPKLDNTLGVTLISVIIAATLYGLTSLQTYIYHSRAKTDSKVLQSSIFFLWLLDTVHLALVTQVLYFFSISNFGNASALDNFTTPLGTHILIAGLSDLLVRIIYAYRIWKFSGKNRPLLISIGLPSFMSFVGSPAMTGIALTVKTLSNYAKHRWVVYYTFASGALADILIASSMCFLLWGRHTGFKRTDSVINSLMLYAIATGALTSCVSVASVVTFATMPDNLVYFGLLLILPKLLLTSLLANLNARQSLRSNDASDLEFSIHLSAIASPVTTSHRPPDDPELQPQQIYDTAKVETTTYEAVDEHFVARSRSI